MLGDGARQIVDGVREAVRLGDYLGQSEVAGLLGLDEFACGDEAHRLALADEVGEALHPPTARNQAETNFREPQLDVRAGDPDITGKRQFEPTTEGVAIEPCDDRGRDSLDGLVDRTALAQSTLFEPVPVCQVL